MPDLAIRERILAALFARLEDRLRVLGDGQADVPLRRNSGTTQVQTTAVDQHDGSHDVTTSSDTAQSTFMLQAELELFAPDGTQLTELYARVCDAVYRDRTFGGIATDARELGLAEPLRGFVKGHPDVIGAMLTIEIQFFTLDDNVRAQI